MKVAFLDRDGVINEDTGYTYKKEDFVFTEGCFEALKQLQRMGFALIIVTNQSGIGRGYYTEQDYRVLTEWYRARLADEGIVITDVFHCPNTPEQDCDCRKPKPGLLLQAARKYPVDFSQSIMIGDRPSDVEAGKAAGVPTTYLLENGDTLYHCVKRLSEL